MQLGVGKRCPVYERCPHRERGSTILVCVEWYRVHHYPLSLSLLPSGQACTASRLECIQPHFADEFAEQLRRVDHHNKREASRKPLPAFSDQHDSLLISPLEVEVQINIHMYIIFGSLVLTSTVCVHTVIG